MPTASVTPNTNSEVLAAIGMLGAWARLDVIAHVTGAALGDVSESVAALQRAGEVRCVGPATFAICPGSDVFADVQAPILAVMHLRAAEELRRRGAADREVCFHLIEAPGTASRASVEALRRHAQRALQDGDASEAVVYLRRALQEPPPEESLDELQLELAQALLDSGSCDEALELSRQIRAREHRLDRDAAATVLTARALTLLGEGEQASWTLIRETERLKIRAPELATHVRGEMVRLARFDTTPLAFWLRDRRGHADLAADPPESLLEVTQLAMTGSTSATEAVAATMTQLADQRLGLADPAAQLSTVWLLIRADEPALAGRAIAEIRAAAGRRPRPDIEGMAGLLTLRYESVPAAVDQLERAVELSRANPAEPAVGPALAFLGHALLEADRTDRLQELLADTDVDAPAANAWTAILRIARARLRIANGQPADGLADLLAVEHEKNELGLTNPACFHHAEPAVAVLRALDRRDEALAIATTNLEHARRWGAPITVALAEGAHALCQPPRQSVGLLERASARLETATPCLDHVRLLSALAAALVAASRRGEAATVLLRALDEATQIGAARLARITRAELNALGRRPRRAALQGVNALTPAELRVASLAAAGHPNKEIAALLHLSVRTVENHLRRIYNKLGTDRRGLSAQIAELEQHKPAAGVGTR